MWIDWSNAIYVSLIWKINSLDNIKTNAHYFVIDDLSYKKVASQSSTEGRLYYKADNAVDGETTTCMRAIPIGIGYSYPEKTVWWKVDLGGLYSIHSINILFKNYDDLDDLGKYSVDIIFKNYAGYYGI